MVIRRYRESDCDDIVEVWFDASRVATPFLPEKFLAGESDNIRTVWMQKAETWVAEADGIVAGFIALIGNEVGAIFVRPEYQGRGIGRSLMDHAASLRDELFLDVFEANAIGRRFYERYGFRLEDEHRHEPTGFDMHRLTWARDRDPH